jgi:hypothetical protein
MNSTLIYMLLGIWNIVIYFIWLVEQSKSMYRLNIVISKLSHVFDPSPHGVLLQQILRCLFGSLIGPLMETPPAPPNFFAFSTKDLVTVCIYWSRLPESVMRTFFISSVGSTSFFVSLSAIIF